MRILDLGCATGRVLRHFACQADHVEPWGCDINRRNIEWLHRFGPPNIRAFQSTALPTLPIEDNFFDVVTAFSVFTHIDDFELAWLLEIRRILKPGGVAYLTVQTDHTWNALTPERPPYGHIITFKGEVPGVDISPEGFKKPMPRDRMVFTHGERELYNCNVFQSAEYLRRVWGRFMEIREIIPDGAMYQDVAVMVKHG